MANNNNGNETRNSASGQSGKKAGTPRRKLNVVFRKQNSTSIKELPKSLKKAADAKSGAAADSTAAKRDAGNAVKKPRPLPAGTKPVRPAAKNANRDDSAARTRSAAQGAVGMAGSLAAGVSGAHSQAVREDGKSTGISASIAAAGAAAAAAAAAAVKSVQSAAGTGAGRSAGVSVLTESGNAAVQADVTAAAQNGITGGETAAAGTAAAVPMGQPSEGGSDKAKEAAVYSDASGSARSSVTASASEGPEADGAGRSGAGAAQAHKMQDEADTGASSDSRTGAKAQPEAVSGAETGISEGYGTGADGAGGPGAGAAQAHKVQAGAGTGASSDDRTGVKTGTASSYAASGSGSSSDAGEEQAQKVFAEKNNMGTGFPAAPAESDVNAEAGDRTGAYAGESAAEGSTGPAESKSSSAAAQTAEDRDPAAGQQGKAADKKSADKRSVRAEDKKATERRQDGGRRDKKQSDRRQDKKQSGRRVQEPVTERSQAAGAVSAAASEGNGAASPAAAGSLGTTQEMPRVRIVKSYANYDVAAIIAEASRKAKKEKEKAQAQAQAERNAQRDASGRNRGTDGQGQGDRRTGGRSFAPRGTGTAGGTGPGVGGTGAQGGQRGQRTQGGAGTDRKNSGAGQSSGRSFDQGKSSGQRGKNSHNARDNRKDKYVDDLSINMKTKNGKGAFVRPEPKKEKPEEEIKVIVVPQTLTIKELAEKLHLQPSAIVKKLFLEGRMVTPNTDLSYEEAEEIAMEYDILCEKEVEVDVIAELLKDEEDDEARLVARNPVVCVMGHVDHGKTSLLDAIRNTNVTSHEAGGITQHIGASVVKEGDRAITFLDTPGHEAFTAMRLRGAQSTDIAVLVVAADDGVKPQTIEAINHARAANVEVIVAINKMDKPHANPDLVRKELSDHGLIAEDWGGKTPMVEVSAKTGAGISDLLDMILLQADIMELKADPKRRARGLVIEAQLDKGRGPVATVLVQKGTLRVGDYVVAGECYGRVRAMVDDKHAQIKQVPPSYPAEILGLSSVPNAGEVFMVCRNEKDAKEIANAFVAEHKKHMLEETKKKMNLDDLFDEIKAGNIKELPIIIKADVQGSVEAVKQSLGKLSNDEVAVKVIHSAAGNINESDVSLASASNAIIIGFNVKPDPLAKAQAEQEKIDMRLYKVIYQAIDDLNAALTGMLAPVYEPQDIGKAVVRQIFKSSGVGIIAGCYVTDGVVERGSKARLFRGGKKLFDGDIASLKRFKDEVKEVKLGFECGIVLEDYSDIEVDDNLEIYKMVQVPRT